MLFAKLISLSLDTFAMPGTSSSSPGDWAISGLRMWIACLTASLIVWVGCLPRTFSDLRQRLADARGVLEAVPAVPARHDYARLARAVGRQ